MITKEQALDTSIRYFHIGECTRVVGPRGGVKVSIKECRRNGKTQTWKTRPNEFRTPVKYGLYEYGNITDVNNGRFHTEANCPIRDYIVGNESITNAA